MIGIAGLLSLVVFFELPHGVEYLHVLQKLAHPVTFGLASLLALSALRGAGGASGSPMRNYVIAFAVAVALGAATEVAQIFARRDPSVFDVFRDALGASTALAGYAGFELRRCRRTERSPWQRALALLGVTGIAVMLTPLIWCATAYVNRNLRFPVVAQFDSPLDLYFVTAIGSEAQRVSAPAGWSTGTQEQVLELKLGSGSWPGLAMQEPCPDWSRYSQLAIDITNPTAIAASITVRVHDRHHNQEYADRFNREFVVPARTRTVVRIALGDIESAPAGRRMDLGQIANVTLFSSRIPRPEKFLLNRILLE